MPDTKDLKDGQIVEVPNLSGKIEKFRVKIDVNSKGEKLFTLIPLEKGGIEDIGVAFDGMTGGSVL